MELSAAECVPPLPSSDTPKSLTTTLAPSWARSLLTSRPMPFPPPVTAATFPSKIIVASSCDVTQSYYEARCAPAAQRRRMLGIKASYTECSDRLKTFDEQRWRERVQGIGLSECT